MKTEIKGCFHFLYQMINRQKQMCRKLHLNMRRTFLCRWPSSGTVNPERSESPSVEVFKNPADTILALCALGRPTEVSSNLMHWFCDQKSTWIHELLDPSQTYFGKKNCFGSSLKLSVTYWITNAEPPHSKTNKQHYFHKVFQVPDCCCTMAVQNLKQT